MAKQNLGMSRQRIGSYTAQEQRGFSFVSVLVLLFLIVFFGNLGVKLVPIYIENYSVKKMIHNLQDQVANERVSATEMKQLALRRAANSGLYALKPDHIAVSKRGENLTIKLSYTVEEHLMYNVSLLVSFDDTIVLTSKIL